MLQSLPILQPYINRHELAGAVTLFADANEILSLEAVGYADIAARRPMQTDTMFWIASQTKPITATAVMMLVEQNLLALDDPIEKHLPQFAGQMRLAEADDDHRLLVRPAHPITVREALAHLGGFPFLTPVEEAGLGQLSLRALSQLYALLPLQSEPGTQYCYSNIGYNLAGRLIEVVSGQPYEQFLQQRLFDPLGMRDTTFWPDAQQLARLAKCYQPDAAGADLEETEISYFRYPLADACRHPEAGGGLFSSAKDVARFCQMILREGELDGKRYLAPESIREMATRQTPANLEKSYGLGWDVDAGSFWHGGACGTGMTIFPDRGLITVWLVQHQGLLGAGEQSHGVWQNHVLENRE